MIETELRGRQRGFRVTNSTKYLLSEQDDEGSFGAKTDTIQWFGWVQGLDVPARYVHLSGRDIDDAYNELHGLVSDDEEEQAETVQECPRCRKLNEPDDRFCSRCGPALELLDSVELEQAEAKVTGVASDTDAALAMQLVEAVRKDKEEVAAFVEQLE